MRTSYIVIIEQQIACSLVPRGAATVTGFHAIFRARSERRSRSVFAWIIVGGGFTSRPPGAVRKRQ